MNISDNLVLKLLSFLCENNEIYLFNELYSNYTFDKLDENIMKILTDKMSYVESILYGLNYDSLFSLIKNQDNRKIIDANKNIHTYNTSITPVLTQKKDLVFTITTCKRLDLFTKTMNSFLNCCLDIELIDKWICVDDNSSIEDRNKMKEMYPFFEFYCKSFEEKGHCNSMNLILDMTKDYKYILHMEDDWTFFFKDQIIQKCLTILESNEKYGQTLFNINYSETLEDIIFIKGGIDKEINGINYVEHEHHSNEKMDEFMKKIGGGANCAYWKHYSLRPSILKRSILEDVGRYTDEYGHFEMQYSDRYYNKGYMSVFLKGGICLHSGRLTSQRFDTTKENAYILNDESQFSKKYVSKIKKLVVNLDRRKDRWEIFKNKNKIYNYERYSAVEGTKLKNSRYLQRLFDTNDYSYRANMIGCAMSHLDIWIKHLYSSNDDPIVILEDDIELAEDFDKKIDKLNRSDWDILFLGHFLYDQYKTEQTYDKKTQPHIERWNMKMSLSRSMGGTIGYMIKKRGIERILQQINSQGMTNCIDTMIQKAGNNINLCYCYPHIVYSECCINGLTDSDIQKDYNNFNISQEELIIMEADYLSKEFGMKVYTTDKVFDPSILHDKKNAVIVSNFEKKAFYQLFSYNLGNPSYKTEVFLSPEKIDPSRLMSNGRYNVERIINYHEK